MIPPKAIKKVKNEIHLEIAAGSLIAYGVFPQTSEGIQKAKETAASKDTWLAPSDLPEYYDTIENDLIIGKETDGIRAIRRHLKDFYGISSASVETPVDTRVVEPEIKISDELKAKQNRKVNHPKLPPHLQRVHSRYMWGQHGVFDLEFKSDIDKAIYHSLVSSKTDKEGYYSKETPQKTIDFREWLFQVTGLSATDIKDHAELKSYKKKILETIKEIIVFEEGFVEVPPVYDGYYQDPDDEEEEDDEEEMDDEEYDDLYGRNLDDLLEEVRDEKEEEDPEEDEDEDEDVIPENLDDLLNEVRVEEEPSEQEKEVEAQADTATQVLVEAEDAQEEAIDESVLDDLPDDVRQSLVDLINKRKGKKPSTTEKKRPSNYVSNTKIYKFLTANLLKIQGQLDAVNNNILRQNELLQANLEVSSGIYESIDIQNTILVSKLNQILQAISGQTEASKKFAEDEEKRVAEQSLEDARDAASVETSMTTLGDKSSSGNSLMRRLVKFFGKRLGKRLWKNLAPRRLKAKARLGRKGLTKIKSFPRSLAGKIGSTAASKILAKPTQTVATNVTTRAVAKGFEHIALPGVTKAIKTADAPAAKAITKADNVLVRAFKSPVIQKALVKTVGKEGAEKLTVKIAAKLIPGVSTAYGLGEGIARIAMGDVKGGFLSFGSAIPFAGYGFAAVDILRDINPDAYTKHIESNLPVPSNENFAAFFSEALGVTPDQYETGGTTNSQTVMLHGKELLIPPNQTNKMNTPSVDPIGGTILAASSQFINKLGPVGAPIAPMFKQVAAPLMKVYDVPSTLVQTNVGGSLPSLESTLKIMKEKKKISPEEELSSLEKDLLQTSDPQSFADKLLKMIDPQGRFQELLKQINNPPPPSPTDTTGIVGDLKGNIVNPMEEGDMQDYAPAKFGADRRGRPGGHMGRDIMGPAGMKVVSALPGTVTLITNVGKLPGGGWSKRIDIDHGNGIVTKYMHVTPSVKKGDIVNAGQQIAVLSPEDDISEGSHLHFEIHKNGVAQNPESFLKRSYKLKDIQSGKIPGLSIQQAAQPAPSPSGDVDVIIPLDHVKPGNQNKIPDTKGGNTFKNASATGADGRERQHQDKAAAKVKAKLEAKGLRVKIVAPEDFGNYEDYDKYITAQASKGVRVVPLHFDAAVGQGGTGFLTRTRAGDSDDAALARPIQKALSTFQRSNPSLGNLGSTDTASNATINRASSSPAALVEMGSMVAWESQHGSNFTSTSTFDKLATGIAEGIYQGGGFNKRMVPPTQRQPAQSKYYLRQGGDKNTDTQILMIPAASTAGKTIEKNATIEGQRFTYDVNYNAFKTNEISSVERAKLIRRLGLN